MAFITFDDRFKLGHPEIDAQHASLFDAVNKLYDAMAAGKARQELGGILAFLRDYTVMHFQAEEGLMKQSAYPAYPEHKRFHDDLTRQVLELEAKHQAGSMTLSLSVMNFLKDWLAQHISMEDRKVAEHLKAKGM
jgi:hemerythrin